MGNTNKYSTATNVGTILNISKTSGGSLKRIYFQEPFDNDYRAFWITSENLPKDVTINTKVCFSFKKTFLKPVGRIVPVEYWIITSMENL